MLRASDALYLRCERCDALLTVANPGSLEQA
jgi:hypothetical protein